MTHDERTVRGRTCTAALLGLALAGLLAGCGSAPRTTYALAAAEASCESRGGWWRADVLIGGYCDYSWNAQLPRS